MPDTAIAKKRRGSHRAGPPLGREFRFRRFIDAGVEVREEGTSGDLIAITGSPIVYNTPYVVRDMFGAFEETMLPGVANDALTRGADVRFLFNHGGGALARSTTGTLVLTDTPSALEIRAVLDIRDPDARSLAVKIERGDVSQMSCGFSVANDMWNEAGDQRSINKFSDFFDVSAVDYPASPTTSVELAYRSIIGQPIESQARVRQLWVAVGKDFRSGTGLSADRATQMQAALDALHSTEEFDIASIIRAQAEPVESEVMTPEATAEVQERGSRPLRLGIVRLFAAPADSVARRAASTSTSFNDIESALGSALQTKFPTVTDDDGDEDWSDIWIMDASDEWVVFQVYGDGAALGAGMWQIDYTIGDDLTVTFTGDPVRVNIETSYVPVARSLNPSLVALELEAEQLRLRGQRRRAA